MNPFRLITTLFLEERDRWFLWLPVGISAGIALYFALPVEPSRFFLVLAPHLLLLALYFHQRPVTLALLALPLSLALGFNAAQIETWLVSAPMLNRDVGPTAIAGRLMLTESLPDGARLTLKDLTIDKLSPEQTPARVRIKVKQPWQEIPPAGTRLSLWGEVRPVSDPVAPHAYDFRRQFFFKGYGGIGWNYGELRTEESPPPSFWDQFNLTFEHMRRSLTQHVYQQLEGNIAAMTAALLNGEQTGIAKPIVDAMRTSGIVHLLSISGVHVSMMGVLVYFPLRAVLALFPFIALRYPIKKWAAFAAILATGFYTLLVGPETPTLRSMLMTSIVMFAIIADRRAMSMRLVTLSAAAVMLLFPDGVMGASFQMSFAAVLAMVAAYEKSLDAAIREQRLFDLPGWINWISHHAGAIITTSLVATAATTPFTLYHFQTFSFYGVIANMIAIPLTSFWIMPNILLTYLTAPFGIDGWFIQAIGWGVNILIHLAEHVATWPYALLHLPAMPVASFITIIIGGLWLCLWRKTWRFAGIPLILIGMLYPFYSSVPDILIQEEGKQWAVRLDDQMIVASDKREKFVVTQWQQRLGGIDVKDVETLPADEQRLRCDKMGCIYRHGSYLVAFPAIPAATQEDCAKASIVITPIKLRDCPADIVIDDNALWHRGAHAITFTAAGPQMEFVRPARGSRPWSPGWR